MKKLNKTLILICLLTGMFSTKNTLACDWYLGGEINYNSIGKDSFLVTYSFYFSCLGPGAGGSTITAKCATTGATIKSVTCTRSAGLDITPVCNKSCTKCQSSSCSFPFGIEKYVFSGILDLTNVGSCCEIILSTVKGSRTCALTTGPSYQNFYLESRLNRCLDSWDNSPVFTNDPLLLLSVGQDFSYSFLATDNDKDTNGHLLDSLTYSIVPPLVSETTALTYTGQYKYNKPFTFWGFPSSNLISPRGFHFNETNGNLMFRPMKAEHTIMAVKVTSWRKINGVITKIGEITRDIIINVTTRPNNSYYPYLTHTSQLNVCAGDTSTFIINSFDWDTSDTLTISALNIPNEASWTDNNGQARTPTGIISWCPKENDIHNNPYQVMLKVTDSFCPILGQFSEAMRINVQPRPSGKIRKEKVGCNIYRLYAEDVINNTGLSWHVNNRVFYTKSIDLKITQAGKTFIKLELSNGGCTTYIYDTLDVPKFINIKLPSDTILCKGESIIIYPLVKDSIGKINYFWSNGDTTSSIQLGPLYKDTMIILNVSDSLFCDVDTMFIKVDNFDISLSQDTITCPGNPVELRAYPLFDEGQIVSSYKWLDLSCTCPQGTADSIIVYMPGVFSCEAINENGCVALDTIVALYDEEPKISFIPIPDICLNNENVILDSFVYPRGGIWYGQDTIIIQNNIFRVNKAESKSYLIFYSYTDIATNCFAFDKTTVIVKDYPKIKIIQPFSFCNVDSFYDLNNYVSPIKGNWQTNPAIQFAYFFNPTNANHAKPLIYEVTDSNGCSNEKTIDIIINPLPQLDFVADQETGTLPLAVQFTNNTSILSGNIMTYLWHFGDGDSSVIEDPLHTYLIADLYDVKLNAVSDSGCYSELTKEQLIEVFSGIDEQENNNLINVYPNPATDELFIDSGKLNSVKSLSLFNILGEMIIHKEETELPCVLDISKLKSGVYMLQIESENMKIQKRIIKNEL